MQESGWFFNTVYMMFDLLLHNGCFLGVNRMTHWVNAEPLYGLQMHQLSPTSPCDVLVTLSFIT